jgi:hypothetical protein
MSTVHLTIGTLVLVGFLLSLILNIRTAMTGTSYTWQRGVTFGAATLLVLQYALGFSLLGSGESITAVHFLIALAAILPLGLEHGYAMSRPTAKERGRYAALANLLTLILVAIAWQIGNSN